MPYIGRFAPSPSGPLHAGSLAAALASYLDARAHHGQWLVRIEDIDIPRTVAGADQIILQQLHTLGLHVDAPVVWQTQRLSLYTQALAQLRAQAQVYPCTCHRRDLPPGPYPGTCRPKSQQQPSSLLQAPPPAPSPTAAKRRAWRFLVPAGIEFFTDRWLGPQSQDVAHEVGDFILKRTDGLWAYQLAVVVDDAAQGVTDIVRGADLLDSTARQRQLARALGLPLPCTLHVPLVMDTHGYKLSKQNHAPALDLGSPLKALMQAWQALGFEAFPARTPEDFWPQATHRWADRFAILRPKDG
ncbi:MAG TPA: tRNA glutamyl-Q(34) synthetase GluQRS [Castellaniella sp.]|uniref:tRNA glutamyl-Q(34) synthetase GluQRS n=1 Tax=Castellaniella sp. TaxID=1955812 RepID=UPI002F14A7AA